MFEQSKVFEFLLQVPNFYIVCFDAEMRYIWTTENFLADVCGKPKSEVIGKKPSEIFKQEIYRGLVQNFNEILQSKQSKIFEDLIPHPITNKQLHWTYSFTPFSKNEIIQFVLCVFRDTTRIFQANIERHKTIMEKEFFCRIASHDLKTPITSLKSCLQLIENRIPLEKIIPIFKTSLNTMESLVNDYLEWGKMSAGKLKIEKKLSSTQELLANAFMTVQFQAESKGVYLSSDVSVDFFYGDTARVSQVLVNLISNALKYGITDKKEVRVEVKRNQNEVLFSVIDYGEGLSNETIKMIFEPYWVEDTKRKGIGLGLHISKTLVEMHGGKMRVDSAPGKGCRFIFNIPDEKQRTAIKKIL